MKYSKKHHRGAMESSHKSHKRSHEYDDMGDSAAPWGHGEHSNMPKEVVMEAYPKSKMGRSRGLDDTINRIDQEQAQMKSKRSRFVSDQH